MYCFTVRATFAGPPKLKENNYEMIALIEKGIENTPCICVGDDWNRGVQAADHLGSSDKVVHRCNGKIGLAETRCSSSSTAIALL